MASVAPDDEVGANVERAVRRLGADPDDASALFDEVGDFRVHPQVEGRVAFAPFSQEIQKIPLRHHGDEFALRRDVAEIRQLKALVADLTDQRLDLLMRQLEKRINQPEFTHQFERRGMNRVAAKIAEKIGVFLQHHDIDAGARQQKSQHHSGGAAAGNAAPGHDR